MKKPLTKSASRILRRAQKEAEDHGTKEVHSGHLLIALLGDYESLSAQVLILVNGAAPSPAKAREVFRKLLV